MSVTNLVFSRGFSVCALRITLIVALFSPYAVLANSGPSQAKPIQWQPCENSQFTHWFGGQEIPERLQCGYLEAPLSYDADNADETVKIAATRLPATGKKQGSVLSISGGPGLPGILVPFQTEVLNESFDIIGYDPRGVGQSQPKIACPAKPDDDADVEPDTATLEKQNAGWLKDCIINSGLKVLKHIGTDEAVNDIDTFRTVLGEDKLSIIAFSYGTQVGQIYAERFPDKVQAMVLDGVVDLTDDAFTSDYKQALSFQRSFERFATYCEKEQQCPLNKANGTAIYHQLLKKVDDLDLTDKNGIEINADNIVRATTNTLYSSEDWPTLAKLLRSIDSDAFDYQSLAQLDKTEVDEADSRPRARSMRRQSADWDDKTQAEQEADNLTIISCADSANPGLSVQKSRLKELQLLEASAFSNYPIKQELPRNICDTWPFKGKLQPHAPVAPSKLPPLLFVAQRHDPATPYEGAKTMAKDFNSSIITVEGDGHTIALSGLNQCVDDEVIDYFINPLQRRGNKGC